MTMVKKAIDPAWIENLGNAEELLCVMHNLCVREDCPPGVIGSVAKVGMSLIRQVMDEMSKGRTHG